MSRWRRVRVKRVQQGTALKVWDGSDLQKYIALRQDLMANIHLADNKAFGLAQMNKDSSTLKGLYLDVVSPNTNTDKAPDGYEIFNALDLEHVKYQCSVLREIVKHKYKIINEMIEYFG